MKLIDQHTKAIMEECKARAKDAGLSFDDESLEYLVSNKDMIELNPKVMIPTLYDYWVHDVEVLKGMGKYKLFPHNPYETVINSRPAISFYNDNNTDWMNIMIFYHVIGHIDFFQNNILFENTWGDDFVGQALADKRLIAGLRSEHGRWVDYAIEFSRSVDNLVGFYSGLAGFNYPDSMKPDSKLDFYFDVFLQEIVKASSTEIYNEIGRYNELLAKNEAVADSIFFSQVRKKYPEFESKFEKLGDKEKEKEYSPDIMEFIRDNSPFLKKEENKWMRSVMNIVRNTSMYFSPQMRSKTINEGWASYWHDTLFMNDERIAGHEVDYAITNANVTSIRRVGLNPYAIGLRLIQYVEELADKGKLSFEYQKMLNIENRDDYNKNTGRGKEAIFKLRRNFSDFMLFNTFVDQDFVDKYNLFVVGQRLNRNRGTVEYFVKSRKAEDYKQMLIDSLYHPPVIDINHEKTNDDLVYLEHRFEGKQIYKPFIGDTMMGINYLWSGHDKNTKVQLETTEIVRKSNPGEDEDKFDYRKVLYTMQDKKLTKRNI
jgi:stage V sporulation protein R